MFRALNMILPRPPIPEIVSNLPPAPEVIRVVETQVVEVPVAVQPEPPAELMAPFLPDALPKFVEPSAPGASSALTSEGERRLMLMIHDLVTRDKAWRAWAGGRGEKR